jgi:hypothetical protein
MINVNLSGMNINGVTRSTPGSERSAVPHTTALTLTPLVSVFTTVDSNGKVHTTSVVFSSISQLSIASADASDHGRGRSPDNESPSGRNPP